MQDTTARSCSRGCIYCSMLPPENFTLLMLLGSFSAGVGGRQREQGDLCPMDVTAVSRRQIAYAIKSLGLVEEIQSLFAACAQMSMLWLSGWVRKARPVQGSFQHQSSASSFHDSTRSGPDFRTRRAYGVENVDTWGSPQGGARSSPLRLRLGGACGASRSSTRR